MTIKLAVLFSGSGRTVMNILDHIERGELDAEISLSIASRAGVAGIERLENCGLESKIAMKTGESPETGDARIQTWLHETQPDLICLCGYLRLLDIAPWMRDRIINIHPALLPKYGGKGMYGLHVHRKILENHESTSGCTVHYVDEEYDHGPVVLQRTCEVKREDSPQKLANRVFALECEAYPSAIKMVAAQQKV